MIKKAIYIWTLAFAPIIYAQAPIVSDKDKTENIQEIKVDILEGLALPALDLIYEYALSYSSGTGASIKYYLGNQGNNDALAKFVFQPYYRQYFYQKQDFGISGVFVEGCLRYASGTTDHYDYDYETNSYPEPTKVNWGTAGIGCSVGKKWVNQSGFLFEVIIGGGRYLAPTYGPDGFFNGSFNVGFRF